MSLEPATVRRLHAWFDGKACWHCGRPTCRYVHGQYYCERHFPHRRNREPMPCKVYHAPHW